MLHSETGKQFSLQNLCSEFFLNPETAEPQQKPQFGEAIIEALGQEKIQKSPIVMILRLGDKHSIEPEQRTVI